MINKGTTVTYEGKQYKVINVNHLPMMTLVGIELNKGKLTHIWIGDVTEE